MYCDFFHFAVLANRGYEQWQLGCAGGLPAHADFAWIEPETPVRAWAMRPLACGPGLSARCAASGTYLGLMTEKPMLRLDKLASVLES